MCISLFKIWDAVMADRGRKTITYCPLYTITYSTLAIKILD